MAQMDYLSYLEDCVTTTEQCVESLSTSVNNLQPGITDLPRLTHVLRNSHRFLVLPAPTVQAHKNQLSHALAPQIDNLIHKAESSIQAQKAKIARLEERLAIVQQTRAAAAESASQSHSQMDYSGRHGQAANKDDGGEDGLRGMESKLDGIDMKGLTAVQRRQVMVLRGKRKRLEEERAALGV